MFRVVALCVSALVFVGCVARTELRRGAPLPEPTPKDGIVIFSVYSEFAGTRVRVSSERMFHIRFHLEPPVGQLAIYAVRLPAGRYAWTEYRAPGWVASSRWREAERAGRFVIVEAGKTTLAPTVEIRSVTTPSGRAWPRIDYRNTATPVLKALAATERSWLTELPLRAGGDFPDPYLSYFLERLAREPAAEPRS